MIRYIRIDNLRWVLQTSIVLLLPFTQLLTFNIGFPLKTYEILFFALMATYLRPNYTMLKNDSFVWILFGFSFAGIISVVLNYLFVFPYNLVNDNSRFGYIIDSVFKYFYFLLCVLSFLVYLRLEEDQKKRLLKIYIIGGILSSVFCLYFFFSSAFGIPIFKLPGYEPQVSIFFVRNGTFKEGNYMAAYLLTCIGISLSLRNYKLLILFFIALATTMSASGIILSMVLMVLYFFRFKISKMVKIKKLAIGVFVIIIMALVVSTPLFQQIVSSKLSFDFDNIESNNDYSRVERTNQSKVAFEMGLNNPIFGVGPSNYALHYAHFNKDIRFDYPSNFKPIPNNVYMELFAEWGVIGVLFFFLFFGFVFKNIEDRALKITFVMLGVYFLTFPTFTLMFIWVFLALATTYKINGSKN